MKTIESFNIQSIFYNKARDNDVEMIFRKVSSESCVRNYFEFNRNKDCLKYVKRGLGSELKAECRSCMREFTTDKSRFTNLSRIFQVDGDKEFAVLG